MASLGQIIFYSMITLIVFIAALIILILALAFSNSPGMVMSLNTFPIGNLSEDVLLSCYLLPRSSGRVSAMSVTWERKEVGLVYQYKNGAPALGNQDPQFKGRTQLSTEGLVAGNASLLLNGVKKSDEGVYTCTISSSQGGGKININLRTAAFSASTFSFSNGVLEAVANRWFPKPNVTWLNIEDDVLQGNTSFKENSEGVYRVSSSLQPSNASDTYNCRMENELVVALSRATLTDSTVTATTFFVYSNSSPHLPSTCLNIMTTILCIYCLTDTN